MSGSGESEQYACLSYTVQRYLQYDTLVAKNLTHFDGWASVFGETATSIELAPEGVEC